MHPNLPPGIRQTHHADLLSLISPDAWPALVASYDRGVALALSCIRSLREEGSPIEPDDAGIAAAAEILHDLAIGEGVPPLRAETVAAWFRRGFHDAFAREAVGA